MPAGTGGIDRAAGLRADPAAIEALKAAPAAKALALAEGKALIDLSPAPRLGWRAPSALPPAAEAVFLGRDASGAGLFAAEIGEDAAAPLTSAETKLIDLRSIAMELPVAEPPIWAEAKALLAWHGSHRACAQCGGPTHLAEGGWRRDCPACGAKHFPRTDPVVIMLVLRRGANGAEDQVLIGRQRHWPPAMFSLLAGYIEPGETVEDAVRRETLEEANIKVGAVGYLASQPWPFPSTLMIGCWAEALTDAITADEEELESARWASKTEMRQALAGEHPVFNAPRKDAIARVLIEAWALDTLEPPF